MKFLVDNQLPLQLAVYLQRRGHECAHVIDLGLDEADDIDLWALIEAFDRAHESLVLAFENGQRIVELR